MYLCDRKHHSLAKNNDDNRSFCSIANRTHAFGQRVLRTSLVAFCQKQGRRVAFAHRGPRPRPLSSRLCHAVDGRFAMARTALGRRSRVAKSALGHLRALSQALRGQGSHLPLLLHASRHYGNASASRNRWTNRVCWYMQRQKTR